MISRGAAPCFHAVARLLTRGDQLACRASVSGSYATKASGANSDAKTTKKDAKKKNKEGSKRDEEARRNDQSFAALLRRAADAIDADKSFRVSVKGKRLSVPRDAELSVEHESDGEGNHEVEFQMKWKAK